MKRILVLLALAAFTLTISLTALANGDFYWKISTIPDLFYSDIEGKLSVVTPSTYPNLLMFETLENNETYIVEAGFGYAFSTELKGKQNHSQSITFGGGMAFLNGKVGGFGLFSMSNKNGQTTSFAFSTKGVITGLGDAKNGLNWSLSQKAMLNPKATFRINIEAKAVKTKTLWEYLDINIIPWQINDNIAFPIIGGSGYLTTNSNGREFLYAAYIGLELKSGTIDILTKFYPSFYSSSLHKGTGVGLEIHWSF